MNQPVPDSLVNSFALLQVTGQCSDWEFRQTNSEINYGWEGGMIISDNLFVALQALNVLT
jgi:hypothetical protein